MEYPVHMQNLHTPVCDLLGCRYPVVLAGMGGVSRSELVVSVINGGGYGFLGMVREQPELIREEILCVRNGSDREFGVNIIPAATAPGLLESQIAACIDMGVASVCLFWDICPDVIRRLKAAGIIVVHQVGTVEDAERAEKSGCDALIVQGTEAGGHIRGNLPLKNILSRILKVTGLPVLAAGGLVSGSDLVDSLKAGAHGIVLGTAFLASRESYAHDYHKERIVAANADDTIITYLFRINWPFGAKCRVIRNSVSDPGLVNEFANQGNRKVIGEDAGKNIYLYSTDSPLRSTSGSHEVMALYAGAGVQKINKIEPAVKILRRIIAEARAILSQENSANSGPKPPIERIPELESAMHDLLASHRALARVALRSYLSCGSLEVKRYFLSMYLSKVRWSNFIESWLIHRKCNIEYKIDDVYIKAMKIKARMRRLRFLYSVECRLLERIHGILCEVNLPHLQEDLHDMLTCGAGTNSMARKLLKHPGGLRARQ